MVELKLLKVTNYQTLLSFCQKAIISVSPDIISHLPTSVSGFYGLLYQSRKLKIFGGKERRHFSWTWAVKIYPFLRFSTLVLSCCWLVSIRMIILAMPPPEKGGGEFVLIPSPHCISKKQENFAAKMTNISFLKVKRWLGWCDKMPSRKSEWK